MKPTAEILERISKNSLNNKDEIFTRLYRYMLRPDIYHVAYSHLYSNAGAATNGINNDTADGFSEKKIADIIKSLEDETYQPNPVRRVYIPKKNGKKRPLGIPSFTDKLVQEVLKMIMEAIYEPVFLNVSHGFRPNRSCHTALKELKKEFNGSRWFVEGDIKGCFDNINHEILVKVISTKIKDARIIKLIYKFLKAGYLEDWKYHKTYSGTPQGGIISPVLTNIYLHELDKFVMKLKADFDVPNKSKYTQEYRDLSNEIKRISYRINKTDGTERERLIAEIKEKRKRLRKTPSTAQDGKRLKYIRYADDFIIAVKGSKEDCKIIRDKLTEFISGSLGMELSAEKTLITHSSECAKFLGYDIRVRRDNTVKRKGKSRIKQRTLNNHTELLVPFEDKIHSFIFDRKIAVQKSDGTLFPVHRNSLLRCTDFEILTVYNGELRGICNYYRLASNYHKLKYFVYLMKYSCLKTLAAKHKCSISKIMGMYADGKGSWAIPYDTKAGKKYRYFANYMDCKESGYYSDIISNSAVVYGNSVTSLEKRLKANVCELCGTTESKFYEIHHVNKLKNLKGKQAWEIIMLAKRRKTLVVCRECHHKIHNQ